MSAIDLETLLKLVGQLDDSTDPNSASARFRTYLQENVCRASDLRAYVDAAISTSGDQYNKVLQDLVNHIGSLLGFNVQYGRYRGVQGQIGFDGLWRSPNGWTLVVEVKTTDVYTVKTSILLGYINELISAGQIMHLEQTLGLYVYGRLDAKAGQLEKAIVAEKRQEQLRVSSVDALLNLLELKQEYELDHTSIMQLMLPFAVRLDTIVDLIFDVTSQERRAGAKQAVAVQPPVQVVVEEQRAEYHGKEAQASYYLLPAADSEDGTPVLENLHCWLDRGLWGLGKRTGYRKAFQVGDKFCFYAARTGVVAECTVASVACELDPRESPKPHLHVPFGIHLRDFRWFEDAPVTLTPELRAELSAFQGRDLYKGWAWFVQGTSKLTREDFELLTRQR